MADIWLGLIVVLAAAVLLLALFVIDRVDVD